MDSGYEYTPSHLEKHNMPYSGLALGDDLWLRERGEGRSLMFTSSDCAAILGLADELRHVRGIFQAKDYSTKIDLSGDGRSKV